MSSHNLAASFLYIVALGHLKLPPLHGDLLSKSLLRSPCAVHRMTFRYLIRNIDINDAAVEGGGSRHYMGSKPDAVEDCMGMSSQILLTVVIHSLHSSS
jgi:hypothetical protein